VSPPPPPFPYTTLFRSFNHGLTDRQPESDALADLLRGVEEVEDIGEVLRWDPTSSVLDGHDHASRTGHVRLKARGDVDAARPFEGVQRIAQDVEHNLLEHHRVRLHAGGDVHRPPRGPV